MWRALVGLGLICLAAYGAVWLANHPETVAITWGGREYTTSLAVGVVGFIALAVAVSLLLSLVRFLMSLPSALGQLSRRRRETRGIASVSRGLVAVGAGDATAARRYAGEAQRLLGDQPLTLLLAAQAAQASGNREGAETSFRRMTESSETRVLGLRGLYVEARRRGDIASARDFAGEASRIAPAVSWASDAVLEAHSADRDWAAATAMIERRSSLGLVDRATSRRHRAVLKTADALEREERDPEGALATAEEALKLAPTLVPAAALAGRLLSRKGNLRRAARVVETAWSAEPHPDLAGTYLNLRPGDSATDRMRRAETLARLSSWSPESRLAITRAAVEARELDRARTTLRPLLEERPTVRVCLVMAEIEGRSGHPGGAREWLARAARAPRDKAWIADGVVSETWAPVSPVSGRLDAFVWDTPPEVLGAPEIPEDRLPPDDDEPQRLQAPADPDDAGQAEPMGSAPLRTAAQVPAASAPEPVEPPPRATTPVRDVSAAVQVPPPAARPPAPAEAPTPVAPPAPLAATPARGEAPPEPTGISRSPDRAEPAPPPALVTTAAAQPAPRAPDVASGASTRPGRSSSDVAATPAPRPPDETVGRGKPPGPEGATKHRLSPPEMFRAEEPVAPSAGAPKPPAGSNGEHEPPARHRLSPRARPDTPTPSSVPGRKAEPAAMESTRPVGPNGPVEGGRRQAGSRDSEPVIFPVPRPPDDPGPEAAARDRSGGWATSGVGS